MDFDRLSIQPRPANLARVFLRAARARHGSLNLYERMVAAGRMARTTASKDCRRVAWFSVFKAPLEATIYRIGSGPAWARRQGAWAGIGQGGVPPKPEGVAA